jgi:GT2 family glycosyltransferase
MNETGVFLPVQPELTTAAGALPAIRVHGKFFFAGDRKFHAKGVTYGPFAVGSHGSQFPERETVAKDFAMMASLGATVLRVFTVPPTWLLDEAAAAGMRVLVGLPWSQHVAFLDDRRLQAKIVEGVSDAVRGLGRHPAIFAYLIGNEIPPDIVRWHGAERVRTFLRRLMGAVKAVDPTGLVSYANFPSTEYLTVDFTDFICFNVYLHDEAAFRRYVARLQNVAFDRPLVLTEFGIDSFREGREEQASILSWQIRAAFDMGVAGSFVFAWTDEWFTGGHLIEDWAFGLVDQARLPKPAHGAVARRFHDPIPPRLARTPRVSVVVCAYNAERTMEACLVSLESLNYGDYEVIVVNDGSTDRTLEIAQRFPYARIISQPNMGLSAARNVGAEAATGEIVAYTDSDCVADPDWLAYLIGTMVRHGYVACGGPNYAPPEDSLVPSAVAVSPGGPTHVLLTDETAEHIAGCNMAFRRDVLLAAGGFDPVFRSAGDDVDMCWRLMDQGHTIGFSPAAMVWHFRRNTVQAYFSQQRGYGKAEALVYRKHPQRFNMFGQAKWGGRIYGDLTSALLPSGQPLVYSGVFGRGLFQTLYAPPAPLAAFLPLTFEWNVAAPLLALLGVVLGLSVSGWFGLLFLPLLTSWAFAVNGALQAPIDSRFTGLKARTLVAFLIYLSPLLRGWERLKWRLKAAKAVPPARPIGAIEQRARPSWRERALILSYWSETGAEKEILLGELMRVLPALGFAVSMDSGWGGFDVELRRGHLSRGFLLCCVENHGGNKRLLRIRLVQRLSGFAKSVLGGCSAGAILALSLGMPIAALVAAILGLAHGTLIGHDLVSAARALHRTVDSVAKEAQLQPVSPLRRPRVEPSLAPSTA